MPTPSLPTSPFLPLLAAALASLPLVACEPETVDETGYLQVPEIDVTSDTPLSETEQPVYVVGSPASVRKAGGTLRADNGRGAEVSLEIDDVELGFVLAIPARASDAIELVYELDGRSSVLLSLESAAIRPEPGCDGCVLSFFTVENEEVRVAANAFDAPNPPYVALNLSRGLSLLGPESADAFFIPGQAGDAMCVFEANGAGSTEALCGTAE